MIAFAVIFSLATIAGASPEKSSSKEPTAIERVQNALPKNWTIEIRNLPSGVEGVALGPRGTDGRPVLVATKLADASAKVEAAALESKLGAKIVSFSESDVAAGAIEVRLARAEGGVAFVVLHVFGGALGEWAFTLIAPEASFEEAYRILAKSAAGLRR